jgi:hypothetical protein
MDPHEPKTEDQTAEGDLGATLSETEHPSKRFRVVKLEERIAPATGSNTITVDNPSGTCAEPISKVKGYCVL